MSDDDLTHYDVLGVQPGASKDEIREAYRQELATAQSQVTNAETARKPDASVIAAAREEEVSVRAAWQILSDPVQRVRYDEGIGVERAPEEADADLDDDAEDDEPTTAVARRSREQTPREARAEARAKAMANRPPGLFSTEHPPTPAGWPPGYHAPPPRARLLALLVDVVVLALIVALQTTLGGLLIEQAYPKESKRLDHVTDCVDQLGTAKDDLGARAATRSASIEKANTDCERFNVYGAPLNGAPTETQSAKDFKKQLEKQIDNRTGNLEDVQTDLRNDVLPGQLAVSFLTIGLALLYLVPSTLRSGRTLGKRLLQLRLVNIDGSPVRFRGAVLHYGVPVMVALLFAPILGPLGYVAVLFGVLTWPRNANYQGLHDRLAGTIVVDG